jgi:glycosyltransferase involved in cell wall biosynthesis
VLLIDVTRLCGRLLEGRLPTGVDRVSLEYLRHFRGRAQALVRYRGTWIVLGSPDSSKVFDALLRHGPRSATVIRWTVGRGYALGWGRTGTGHLLLNTGHSGLENPAYAMRVRKRGLRSLFFLHDLIPITHPEYARPLEAELHARRLHTMLSVGTGIIVNSQSTRRELESYAVARAVPVPPCAIAPLAPIRLPAPASERPIKDRYFVVLSTIEPRKNHSMLLHRWRQLSAELGPATPHLVLIGQRGWECRQVTHLLESHESLRRLVIEKRRCTDAALATWLHHAQALLFPTFVEGFGMPLIEALSLGLPVIASNLPVFREIAGDIPDYLHPLDGLGWKARVLDYAQEDSAMRHAQLERMSGFQAPTWENHFAIVDEMIGRIGGSG